MKATEVVLEVTAIALAPLRKAKAILLCRFPSNYLLPLESLQPSINTKMSSAAIPSTIKMTKLWSEPK